MHRDDPASSDGPGHRNSRQAPWKPAPKKPVRPDFDARDAKLQKLREKLKEYDALAKAKAVEIDALVNEAKANNKLEQLKRTLNNTTHSRSQTEKLIAITEKRLADLKSHKPVAKVKGVNLKLSADDINRRMNQLQEKLAEEQNEEERDRMILRIQELHSSWQMLTGEQVTTTAGTGGGAGGKDFASTLAEELQKQKREREELVQLEQQQRSDVEDLRAKIGESQPAIDRLRQEREVCLTVMRKLRDKINEINEEYSTMFDNYKQQMKEWNAKMDSVMSERRAEREAEQKARDAERAKREMETKGAPFSRELMRCEQLLLWCRQYARTEAPAAESARASPLEMDGMVALTKDKNVDDVFSTSRSKGKKKGGKACKKPSGNLDGAKVQLDMETLNVLHVMKLPVPSTVGDIPGLVTKVSLKKAEYEDKQKRALGGEVVPEDDEAGPSKTEAETPDKVATGPVCVSMRCDEAFGQVILEIMAN